MFGPVLTGCLGLRCAVVRCARPAAALSGGVPAHTEPVFINTEEKISAVLSKDGGVESCEVQGSMSLQIGNEADACLRVQLAGGANPGYQFKTHPNIDKAVYRCGTAACTAAMCSAAVQLVV